MSSAENQLRAVQFLNYDVFKQVWPNTVPPSILRMIAELLGQDGLETTEIDKPTMLLLFENKTFSPKNLMRFFFGFVGATDPRSKLKVQERFLAIMFGSEGKSICVCLYPCFSSLAEKSCTTPLVGSEAVPSNEKSQVAERRRATAKGNLLNQDTDMGRRVAAAIEEKVTNKTVKRSPFHYLDQIPSQNIAGFAETIGTTEGNLRAWIRTGGFVVRKSDLTLVNGIPQVKSNLAILAMQVLGGKIVEDPTTNTYKTVGSEHLAETSFLYGLTREGKKGGGFTLKLGGSRTNKACDKSPLFYHEQAFVFVKEGFNSHL